MTIAGSTIATNAMSLEEMRGLRRAKPLNTAITGADTTDPRHGAPVNTKLSSAKPPLRTQVTTQDLTSPVARKSTLSRHEQLVKETQKWVAQAFYGTILKQMRDSPFRSDLFDGGRGGQAFGAMYDQELAERMSRGAGSKLVNTIVRHIEARSGQVQQQLQPSPQAQIQEQLRHQMQLMQQTQAQEQVQYPKEVR